MTTFAIPKINRSAEDKAKIFAETRNLDQLTDIERRVYLMWDLDLMSYTQIAKAIGDGMTARLAEQVRYRAFAVIAGHTNSPKMAV